MTSLTNLQDNARVALREWSTQYLAWLEMLDDLPITDKQRETLDHQRIRLLHADRDHLRAVQVLDAVAAVYENACINCEERDPDHDGSTCTYCHEGNIY